MTDELNAASPEAIATIVGDAIREGTVTTLREISPLLMRECGLDEADALAISEAVAQKWQLRFFPPITRMELFLTENCNLRCDYCFVEGKNREHAMSWETARRAIDLLIAESRSSEDVAIMFMGGEPFLMFDVLRQAVEYAESRAAELGKKTNFSTTTNGTLFTEEMLSFCRDHRISFLLSLDGAPETHDRHRQTVSGRGSSKMILERLPLMKKYQPYLGARMTVQKDAVRDICSNFEWLVDLGMNHFIIGPATGIDWSDEELQVYEDQMRCVVDTYKRRKEEGAQINLDVLRQLDQLYDKPGVWGCQAGRHSITVAADGDIYACSKMLGLNDLGGVYRLGDLDHGITDVDARAELIGMWQKRTTKCMECDMRDACSGGCFATNYGATGSIYEPCESDCRILRHNFAVRQYAAELLAADGGDQAQETPDGEEPCVV